MSNRRREGTTGSGRLLLLCEVAKLLRYEARAEASALWRRPSETPYEGKFARFIVSAVSEWIVREYFESLGYLVRQPRKHVAPSRQKREEETDLIVFNPGISEHRIPEHFVWDSRDLKTISRATVGIRGWHTERFYASTFEQAPDILRFVESESVRFAEKILGSSAIAKILCLPRLPASKSLKQKTVDVLKKNGVDGVISFRTMLLELISYVDAKKNYEKSDLLQMIRILKNYELIKPSQLEFFEKGKRRNSSIAYKENEPVLTD